MNYKERVVHGTIQSEHIVQFFDTAESLADAVADFVGEGYGQGETLLLAITPEHWVLVAAILERRGCALAAAMASGQLTVLDAGALLHQFMRDERPVPALFDATVGDLVRHLNARGSRLRIYGEMVDQLAARGDLKGAHALESCWNTLGEREPFTLFCAYSGVHFGDGRTAAALYGICGTHSEVRVNPRDVLSAFLLDTSDQSQPRSDSR